MGRLGGHNQLVFGILQRRVCSSPHWYLPRQLLCRSTVRHCEEREEPRGPCCPTSLSQVYIPRAGLTVNVVFLGHVTWWQSSVVLPSRWGDEAYLHIENKPGRSSTDGKRYGADTGAPAGRQKADVRGFPVSPLDDKSEHIDGAFGDG